MIHLKTKFPRGKVLTYFFWVGPYRTWIEIRSNVINHNDLVTWIVTRKRSTGRTLLLSFVALISNCGGNCSWHTRTIYYNHLFQHFKGHLFLLQTLLSTKQNCFDFLTHGWKKNALFRVGQTVTKDVLCRYIVRRPHKFEKITHFLYVPCYGGNIPCLV